MCVFVYLLPTRVHTDTKTYIRIHIYILVLILHAAKAKDLRYNISEILQGMILNFNNSHKIFHPSSRSDSEHEFINMLDIVKSKNHRKHVMSSPSHFIRKTCTFMQVCNKPIMWQHHQLQVKFTSSTREQENVITNSVNE